MLLDVEVLSPTNIIFKGKASSIVFPGESGVFEVLAFHKHIMSRLLSGIVSIDGKKIYIKRGVVNVNKNKVLAIIEEM